MLRAIRVPREPQHPSTLAAFNFRYQDGHFLSNHDNSHFSHFATDNDRYNDSRREAFHSAVRAHLTQVLEQEYGLVSLKLRAADVLGDEPEKSHRPYVNIMCTTPGQLKLKRDVVVVVGETGQDAGIWAWRYVQREGGVEKGTVAGLVSRLRTYAASLREEGGEKGEGEGGCQEDDSSPGVVVLNPGQLFYSYAAKTNMTLTSWNTRCRKEVTDEPFQIDRMLNTCPGHRTPHEHCQTIFKHILPQILGDDTRLHILAIGDGSIPTVAVLDDLLKSPGASIEGRRVQSIALIEPQHDAPASSELQRLLSTKGKAWTQSEEPMGTLIDAQTPPVYSAGIADGVETVFPHVIGEVLGHFWDHMDESDE